jgi:beta-xylosidase
MPLRHPGQPTAEEVARAGNPIFPGWYADPEGVVFETGPGDAHRYWIYPTFSAPYDEQLHFDAFSSPDLVTWTKHERVLTRASVAWARRAMWAPSVIEKGGRYYFFFGANDIQNDEEAGGIGVAVGDSPAGPFRDYLGRPLVDRFQNGAQPIDQFVFRDHDGAHYLIYGGWRHCNVARLRDDFTGFEALKPGGDAAKEGDVFREITPEGYVEGPFMFTREVGGAGGAGRRVYYFMWSEGGWTGPDYSVAYAMADSPLGPFTRVGKILEQDASIATGAGHHSVIRGRDVEGERPERWYIVYHRRPLGETDRNARVVCIDRMEFNEDGTIKPVRMTFEGVESAGR